MKLSEKQWLTVIVLAGILLRLFFVLPTPSAIDEQLTVDWGKDIPALLATLEKDVHPPGFYVLLQFLIRIDGGIIGSRVLLMLISCISIVLGFHLAKTQFGFQAGLAAAALLATSPVMVLYATHLRPYGILMALFLLSTILLQKILKGNAGKIDVIGLGLVYAFSFWLHYFSSLIILSHLATLAWHERKAIFQASRLKKRMAGVLLASLVFVVPLLPFFWTQLTHVKTYWKTVIASPFGLRGIILAISPAVFFFVPLPIGEIFASPLTAALSILVIAISIGLLLSAFRTENFQWAIQAIGPLVFSFGLFAAGLAPFFARYVVFLLPLWLVLIAASGAGIQNVRLKKAAFAILIGLNLALLIQVGVVFWSDPSRVFL